MVRSTGASATTSSSPNAKRLVTPRMVRLTGCASSVTVLRTPLQEAISDRDDDSIGDKPAGADDDHAGDHEIGTRKRAAIHDDGAETGGNARHFSDHDQYPSEAVYDLQKHSGSRATKHRGSFEQARVDRAHAEYRVEQDRIKRAEEHQEDRRIRPQAKKDH